MVEYGITDAYGETATEDTLAVVEHSLMLTGLLDGTDCHFRAVSSDGYRMVAVTAGSAFSTLELEPTGPQVMWWSMP